MRLRGKTKNKCNAEADDVGERCNVAGIKSYFDEIALKERNLPQVDKINLSKATREKLRNLDKERRSGAVTEDELGTLTFERDRETFSIHKDCDETIRRLVKALERIKLECEATQPSELDLFKNLVEWDLYSYVLEGLKEIDPKYLEGE